MKWAARLVVLTGVVAGAHALVAGCDDSDGYIYEGEPYYPPQQCMLPLTAVDVLAGTEPLQVCAPVCILSPPEDGGVIAYISTMCPPYPQYPNTVADGGTSALCAEAFAAYNRDALCEDGGVVYPNGEDSGTDAAADTGAAEGADANDGAVSVTGLDAGGATDAGADGGDE